MAPTRLVHALALVVMAAAGVGCDDQDGDGVSATSRSFAYVAASYLGDPQYATDLDLAFYIQFNGPYVGADLRTMIGNPDKDPARGGKFYPGTLEDPEEDPGYVKVAVRKGEVIVVVVFSGPHITRHPNTVDPTVTIDQLVDIARDDRIDLTTTQAAAGAAVDCWEETAPPVGGN